jgi:catechol 2,3-dioxygenase-like lactoylglutathione lyase family enzyme
VIRVSGVVIDVNDLDRMARFWGGLLDLEITRRESGWVDLGSEFALQRVPEGKAGKNRLHLDLVADRFEEATARAAALGGRPVSEMHEDLWQVWADPEGNEFCLCVS